MLLIMKLKQRDISIACPFTSCQMYQNSAEKYWAVHAHCFTDLPDMFYTSVKHQKLSKVDYLNKESFNIALVCIVYVIHGRT